MEVKDAIKILQVAKSEVEWSAPLDYQEAFDMAIIALQEQDATMKVARDIATIIENEQDMRVILKNAEDNEDDNRRRY